MPEHDFWKRARKRDPLLLCGFASRSDNRDADRESRVVRVVLWLRVAHVRKGAGAIPDGREPSGKGAGVIPDGRNRREEPSGRRGGLRAIGAREQ